MTITNVLSGIFGYCDCTCKRFPKSDALASTSRLPVGSFQDKQDMDAFVRLLQFYTQRILKETGSLYIMLP